MSIKGSSDSSIPSVSWPGRKSNFFSASALSGTTLSTVKTPSSATLRSSGQATDGSLVESPRRCKLRLQVKRYWAVLEALRQFVHQEIRRLLRRIRCGEMHEVLGHQLITDCLPRARLVDEHESIHAIVLFVGKAIGRGQGAKGRGHGRMARRELIEFC